MGTNRCKTCEHEKLDNKSDPCRYCVAATGWEPKRDERNERIIALETALDSTDCTHREGGDTRHCRHDSPCLRCQRDYLRAVLLSALNNSDHYCRCDDPTYGDTEGGIGECWMCGARALLGVEE